MWECKHCQEQFDNYTISQKANHSRWCIKNPDRKVENVRSGQIARHNRELGYLTTFLVQCAECQEDIEVQEREKQHPLKSEYFCSRSCANSRGGQAKAAKPEYLEKAYVRVCFMNHKKECVICGENRIVAVHHLDGNHVNNDPSNLIPLCPTHHQYWHSRYRPLVEKQVLEYAVEWKLNGGLVYSVKR